VGRIGVGVNQTDRNRFDPLGPKISQDGRQVGQVERVDFDLTAGETMSVAAQDLPTERPLALNLLLPAALPSADALPARIVAMDGSRELKLPDAAVANDRGKVQVRIESGWLSPGRYLIEIETTEPSDLALRGYPLEVR